MLHSVRAFEQCIASVVEDDDFAALPELPVGGDDGADDGEQRRQQMWTRRRETLRCEHEPRIPEDIDLVHLPDDLNLHVLSLTLAKRRVAELNHAPRQELSVDSDAADAQPLTRKDVLLEVSVYHAHADLPTSKQTHQRMGRFQVLSTQPLTALVDRIECVESLRLDGPQHRYSNFFFVENTFYDDTRGDSEPSKSIREWVLDGRLADPNLGLYHATSMESVTFSDLSIVLGYPYLYGHQGSCQHILVFSDLRQWSSLDPPDRRLYPYISFLAQRRVRKCALCDIFCPTKLVYGEPLSAQNPTAYCAICYEPFHQTAGGDAQDYFWEK